MENSMKQAMDVFTNDQWITDINAVLSDAEALLSATADLGGEQIAGAQPRRSLRCGWQDGGWWRCSPHAGKTREAVRLTDLCT
jgi:hypothetical protein